VIRGNGVFGIFAADHRTEMIWGAAAIVLLALSLLPRVGRRERVAEQPPGSRRESAAFDELAVPRNRGMTEAEPAVTTADRTVTADKPEARPQPAGARSAPAEISEPPTTNRNRPAADEQDPVATQEGRRSPRVDPAVTAEQPETAREDSHPTRQEPSIDGDKPGVSRDDSETTAHDTAISNDELVWPRDRPSTSSDEPPAKT